MVFIGTFLMALSGVLPVMNNIISWFVDLENIPCTAFPNMNVAVFQYSLLIVPFVLIPAVFLRAFWVSYLIPIFSYLNIIAHYVLFQQGIEYNEDWIYYTAICGISLIVLVAFGFVREYFLVLQQESEIKDEIINLYEKEFKNEGK